MSNQGAGPPPDLTSSDVLEQPISRRRLFSGALSVGGAVALSGASASILAACGNSGSTTAQNLAPEDVRNATGTIRVLGWQAYDQPAQDAGSVKAKWSYITSGPEIVTKIRPAGSYDVFTSSAFQMGEFLALNRLVPIDTSLLTNYDSLVPILRDNPTWKGPDGKVYGLPIEYSAIYMPYLASKVPAPTSSQDLLKSEYQGAIGLNDDPTQTIPQIARILGKQGDPARLTDAEFAGVKKYLSTLKPQVRTLYATGEELGLLNRGDINLALTSYANIFSANIPDLRTTFFGSFGFADGLSILAGADQAAATSWIDQALSLKAQQELAKNVPIQPAVLKASSSLPPVLQKPPFAKLIKVSPLMTRPPLKPEAGVASLGDWTSAWNDYKASF
jgi:spermidine/putrescine-binding protein